MQPTSVVMRALRSRLSAISLGLPSTHPPTSASSMPLNRVVSLNYGRGGSTSDAEERDVSNQPQQLLQPPAPSSQFLTVNSTPRLSESSALSTPASSRGGSLVYFTRFVDEICIFTSANWVMFYSAFICLLVSLSVRPPPKRVWLKV